MIAVAFVVTRMAVMKRKLAWMTVVLSALLLGGWLLWINQLDPDHGIRKGMTAKEVELILKEGGKSAFQASLLLGRSPVSRPNSGTCLAFGNERGTLHIRFENGIVTEVQYDQKSLVDRVRNCLGW
jgi:hypothetical protein